MALAWLRGRGPDVVPIVGARTTEQLAENLGHLDLTVPDEHLARLDRASAVDLGFPHDRLAAPAGDALYSGLRDAVAVPGHR